MKGFDFFDSQILGAYVCLGLLFAGPATAQTFQDGNRSSFAQAKARIFAGVVYGEVVALTVTGVGIATVYMTHRGSVPQPDWNLLVRCAVFGLGAAAMMASLAAWAAAQFSRGMAMLTLRLAFFALLIVYFYRGRRLVDLGLTGAAVCLAIAAVLIELLRRSYRDRSPLPSGIPRD